MAIDNILHRMDNYRSCCSVCQMIVLAWLMDDQWVLQSIMDGMSNMELGIMPGPAQEAAKAPLMRLLRPCMGTIFGA